MPLQQRRAMSDKEKAENISIYQETEETKQIQDSHTLKHLTITSVSG